MSIGEATYTARLADALYRAGILTEEDWRGDLDSSLQAGMVRFLNGELGFGEINQLEFYYTSDVHRQFRGLGCGGLFYWGANGTKRKEWRNEEEMPPIGGFGLAGRVFQNGAEVFNVGRRVREMEDICPGSGYATLFTAIKAMSVGATVFTPLLAMEQAEYWDVYRLEGESDDTNIGVKKLLRHVPKEACQGLEEAVIRRRVSRARKLCTGDIDRTHFDTAIEQAQGILDVWKRAPYGDLCDLYHFEDEVIPNFIVRWSEDDDIPALADDLNERITNDYSWTLWTWLLLWHWDARPEERDSLETAITKMRTTLDMLGRGYRLLQHLHLDPRLIDRVRIGAF